MRTLTVDGCVADHSPVVRPRMARLLGKSLVWVEGEAEHRRMRALFTPALSAAAVKAGMPDFYLVTSKVRLPLLSPASPSPPVPCANLTAGRSATRSPRRAPRTPEARRP